MRSISILSGWRRAAVAFVAGSLSVLAMAPFFFWPVLFLTLPVLVWLIDGAGAQVPRRLPLRTAMSLRDGAAVRGAIFRAASAGWWFGFGYFLFGLFWIGEAFLVEADKFAWLLPFAVTLMPAGLALFTALACAAARLVWPDGVARIIVLAIALSGAEWLRGHVLTGFPWNVLGYALTWPLPLMQSAAVLGIYGLTLLAVLILASPLVLAADAKHGAPRRQAALRGAAIAIVPLAFLYAFGVWQLSGAPAPLVDDVRIRIVQASVPQHDKWNPAKQRSIFADQLALSRHDPSGRRDDLAGITHLIWPEAAMPFLPLEHPEALAAIGELLPGGTQLISGALRLMRAGNTKASGPRRGYNSLMVFEDDGRLQSVYDKIHLVPFGEYLPFQTTLESIGLEQLTRWRGRFSIGATPRPLLSIVGLPPVAGLICYEAIFPGAVVHGDQRPGLLINVTNDGWFGNSTGPPQHFHQARVRAVEEGLPLLRAANNGISAVVDGRGRVVAMLALNERNVIDSGVPSALDLPPYAKFGDWTFVGLVLLLTMLALLSALGRWN
ncbi:MAG: apolipoprotein N-acyltransferase [Hyphomicrobium sp.]